MTGRGRVLVVDDEPAVLDVLREFLEGLGYEASTAANGQQAIAAMAIVRPHVVFLDLLMPGLEVLNYVRKHHPTEPVIVITGNIDHQMARQARAGGAFAVVGKPIDFDALEVLVARAMRLAPRP